MKKAILIFLLPICFHANAQQSGEENKDVKKGFQKERLFTGGNVNLGFSSYYTNLGITPQFGYSLTDWADAGITINLNYISQRDFQSYGDKLRQTIYGPGAFVRLFPVRFLFGTAQYEYNIIKQKYIPANNSNYLPYKNTRYASSLLVGGGYAGGREKGNNTYYFISIMWDILGDKNSPYIDGLDRSIPVIRAGYNIGLFQGRNRKF
jgi:hypothetical protein